MSRISQSHPERDEREPVKPPTWEPPAEVRALTPPDPEERSRVLELIRATSQSLGAPAAVRPIKKFAGPRRCERCPEGQFLHAGVRYCRTCYVTL